MLLFSSFKIAYFLSKKMSDRFDTRMRADQTNPVNLLRYDKVTRDDVCCFAIHTFTVLIDPVTPVPVSMASSIR